MWRRDVGKMQGWCVRRLRASSFALWVGLSWRPRNALPRERGENDKERHSAM